MPQGVEIIHRVLKPSDVVVGADCDYKLAGFGVESIHASPNIRLLSHVITRWYRSPRYCTRCGAPGDMWSLLEERMPRQPYLPGNADVDQEKLIYQARGTADGGE